MGYFDGWFGDDYLDTWFDPPQTTPGPSSGNGGVSNHVTLATIAPKPVTPVWRQIPGSIGSALNDVRRFLGDTLTRPQLWGTHVDVTFTAATTATRVATGLGGPAKGYKVVRANADVRVWDASPAHPDETRGVIWLQASAPAKVTIYFY